MRLPEKQHLPGGFVFFKDRLLSLDANQVQGCVLLDAELKRKNLLWFGGDYPHEGEEVHQIMSDNIPGSYSMKMLFTLRSLACATLTT